MHQPVMMMESASMMRSKADTGSEMQIQEQTISNKCRYAFQLFLIERLLIIKRFVPHE
jgi:hypothetical protein